MSPSLAAIIGEKTKIIESGPTTAPRKLIPVQNPMSGKGLKTINVVGVSGGGGSQYTMSAAVSPITTPVEHARGNNGLKDDNAAPGQNQDG